MGDPDFSGQKVRAQVSASKEKVEKSASLVSIIPAGCNAPVVSFWLQSPLQHAPHVTWYVRSTTNSLSAGQSEDLGHRNQLEGSYLEHR